MPHSLSHDSGREKKVILFLKKPIVPPQTTSLIVFFGAIFQNEGCPRFVQKEKKT